MAGTESAPASTDELASCRRALIASGALARPVAEASGHALLRVFGRTKRRPLPSRSGSSRRSPNGSGTESQLAASPTTPELSGCSDPVCFKASYWSRAAAPLKQPLLVHATEAARSAALKFSVAIQLVERASSLDDPAVVRTVQALLQRCLESDLLCTELLLQLVRQTSWESVGQPPGAFQTHQLICAACAILHPAWEPALRLLRCHLGRLTLPSGSGQQGEVALCAQFCLKCLAFPARPARRFPPSAVELVSLFARSSGRTMIHLLNGECRQLEFHPHLNGEEAVAAAHALVPLGPGATGWALYEQFCGAPERCTGPNEYVADALFRWEQFAQQNSSQNHLRLVFKKRLFVAPYVDPSDPMEVSLLAHQCLTDFFEGRLPLTPDLAAALCGLQAARDSGADATLVRRILPRRWRDRVSLDAVSAASAVADAATTTAPDDSPERRRMALDMQLLAVCRSACPLFGCAVFQCHLHAPLAVAPGLSTGDPCVLAVGEAGLQLLPDADAADADWQPPQPPLASFTYANLLGFGSDARCLLCLQLRGHNRLALQCRQANQAAHLIRDYLLRARQSSASTASPASASVSVSASAVVQPHETEATTAAANHGTAVDKRDTQIEMFL